MTEEKRSAIALSYLTGVGPIRAKKLLALAGSFVEIFSLGRKDLQEQKIPPAAIEQILARKTYALADDELKFIDENDIAAIDCLDELFPRRLQEFADSPIVVYYRGNAPISPSRTVGIVGTRKPTPHGQAVCERLIEELASYGVTVYSGLAYGIDITAHKASLQAGVPTVGVLAHGLNEVYPSSHRDTARAMLQQGGLMTEYPSRLRSRKEFFPMRNRIIAAQSDALIIIESGKEGGSMITANLAQGYATPTFAVPGRLKDKMSTGCNTLIKSHRAHLIESAADVAYVLGWKKRQSNAVFHTQPNLFENFTPTEKQIVDRLQLAEEADLDELQVTFNIPAGELATTLLNLEFKGIVRSLPGKRYALA